MRGVVDTVLSTVAVVAGVVSVIALAFVPLWGREDRYAEERAREFFDAHGHWPDEPPPGADAGAATGS